MTATSQKIELMQISTVDDLNAEILRVKARTIMQKELLKDNMKQLPKEALKYGAIAIIPGFLAARITKRGYGVASGLLGWLFHRKNEIKRSAAKKQAVKSAKSVGIFTGLSYLFAKLSKKL
jgi:hypothetical protein